MGALTTELILVVLLLRSVGAAFHTPCLQAVTPQIVPPDQLTRCSGYSQALESVSQILSPAVAAVLYSSWSLSGIVFLDVIGALIAVFTLGIAVIPELQRDENSGGVRVLREAMEGFRILQTNKGMLGLVFSVGLLFGSLVLSRWGGTKNRVYTIVGSFLLMSFSLFISGMLPPGGFWLFAACSWLMGVSGPFYWGMYTPLLQSNFEDRYLGRVLSLSSSIRLLSGPLGLVVSGAFAERYGVEKWFLIAGVLVLAAAFLCVGVPAVRECDG